MLASHTDSVEERGERRGSVWAPLDGTADLSTADPGLDHSGARAALCNGVWSSILELSPLDPHILRSHPRYSEVGPSLSQAFHLILRTAALGLASR